MLYLRRLVWFIASRLILVCVVAGLLVIGFNMCLNTANIYIIVTDGMQKRAEVMLTREDSEKLNFFFDPQFLANDKALEGTFDGSSVYGDYRISDFDYELTIEKLWAWPWDAYATCTVVERIPSITGTVISSRRSELPEEVPAWQGGRYDITLVRNEGEWKILGMQQTKVLMEAAGSNTADSNTKEVKS